MIAAALAVALAQTPAAGSGKVGADLRAVAALAGEPRIVSAAGLDGEDRPILTLENPSAFDSADARRRIVLVGTDLAAADAVLAAIRWMKHGAPRGVRVGWIASALPLAHFRETDRQSLERWLTFQAPDLVVEVGSSGSVRLDGARVETTPAAAALSAIRGLLTAERPRRSPLHERIIARVGRDPIAIARVLAKRYPEAPSVSYIPSVSWVNTLKLATLTHDTELRAKVIDQIKPWLVDGKPMFGERIQLTAVAGAMIFADLAAGGENPSTPGADQRAIPLADQAARLAASEKSPGVAQYGGGWTDDMFMSASILARTGRWHARERDLDVVARLLIAYASRLQRADGLFNHAVDGPAAWGRGNGFAAMGLAEGLTALPPDHSSRAELLAIYRRQMAAVKAQQAPDGMWRQIIDEPAAYREESATAMLLTALARGVRLGWIDRSYLAAVRRAWTALAAHVADDGMVVDVCASTGGGPTRKYYFDRPAITGADDRGGAMALLAAMEMVEMR